MEPQSSDLTQLRAALEAGQKDLRFLKLGEIDGLDLDLSGCNLDGSCFKEARFGHATLRGAQAYRCCFQRALIWGADLSELDAPSSCWHEADLSGSRLQGANFSHALGTSQFLEFQRLVLHRQFMGSLPLAVKPL